MTKQECIPVGCVPPTHWPYPVVSHVSQGCLPAPPPDADPPLDADLLPLVADPPRCRPLSPWMQTLLPLGADPPPFLDADSSALIQTPSLPSACWEVNSPFPVHAGKPPPPLPPWTEWLTDRCKNITFSQLRLQVIIAFNTQLWSWRPLLGKILDPPLKTYHPIWVGNRVSATAWTSIRKKVFYLVTVRPQPRSFSLEHRPRLCRNVRGCKPLVDPKGTPETPLSGLISFIFMQCSGQIWNGLWSSCRYK